MTKYQEKLDYYIFFPYLKISKKINFCGVNLFPTIDINTNLKKEIDFKNKIKVLNNLKNLFYLSYNYKIENFTFTLIKERGDLLSGFNEKLHLEYSKLLKIRELFIYLYSSFLDNEICNIFALIEDENIPNIYNDNSNLIFKGNSKIDFYPGYMGILNKSNLLFLSKNDKIFPPNPSFNQNYSQDIFADLKGISKNSVYNFFLDNNKLLNVFENERLLQSLKWYNNSTNSNNSNEEKIINLSIAFESLLELDEEKIKKSFINSILMILGYNERLKNWAQQFYDARSEIMHKGKTIKLFFEIGNQTKVKYRELASYGRLIFRIIFNTLINGEYLKTTTKLKDLFVCNKERFNQIIEYTKDGKDFKNKFNSLEKTIEDIYKYKHISEDINLKDIIECITKISDCFLKNNIIEDDKFIKILKEFIDSKSFEEKLLKIEVIYDFLKNKKDEDLSNEIMLYKKLLKSSWVYLIMAILYIKQNINI